MAQIELVQAIEELVPCSRQLLAHNRVEDSLSHVGTVPSYIPRRGVDRQIVSEHERPYMTAKVTE